MGTVCATFIGFASTSMQWKSLNAAHKAEYPLLRPTTGPVLLQLRNTSSSLRIPTRLARFNGMIIDVGDKFTEDVAAFDEKKCFSHTALNENAMLPWPYYFEFVNRLTSPGSTINTNKVSCSEIGSACIRSGVMYFA